MDFARKKRPLQVQKKVENKTQNMRKYSGLLYREIEMAIEPNTFYCTYYN